MLHKLLLRSTLIILLLSLVFLSTTVAVASTEKDFSQAEFEALSMELSLMNQQNIFTGGSGKPVKFNVNASLTGKQSFSPEGIALAQELADFTNQVVNAKGKALSLKGKPNLSKYFKAAAAYGKATTSTITNTAPESLLSEYVCGTYWHSVPASQVLFLTYSTTYSSQKAAEDKIKSWGYHSTGNLAGGGFTRPQTYNWLLCGFNTFRDHAYAYYYNGRWRVREQNYTGSIPGEPNPEVYASGPWPYATWPAYVYWWHRWGPGA